MNLHTVHHLLHNNGNPTLIKYEEVKYYILIAQVLTKIIFYNLLSKSGEHNHARGCALLLIYCLLKDIRENIPNLIIDFMLSENLLIPSRNLSFGMMFTHLFKYFKINVSVDTAFSVNIDHTVLKRMQA